MLTSLEVQNFRSIEKASVEFRPITVFFGPTSSGKSSLLYALLTLRNFVLNPNQVADGLFNLGFLNLGGFEPCVYNHAQGTSIGLLAHFAGSAGAGMYGINLRTTDAEIATLADYVESPKMSLKVPVPYATNLTSSFDIAVDGVEFTANWNGFASTVTPKSPTSESLSTATVIAARLNAPAEAFRRIDICPQRRGFFRPSYSPSALTHTPTTEDEVATLIINDPNAAPRISIETTEIFERDFRIYTAPGTATTYLQTTEQTAARVPGYLVNDGFGVNQVVYLLAKIHRPDSETILIEEPEVHLHPTAIRKFAQVVARLAKDEQKQLVFTTHSEQFLLSILACVKAKVLSPGLLACYHVVREGKKTQFNLETVTEDGQISGGLSSFMEAELEDIKTFLLPKK